LHENVSARERNVSAKTTHWLFEDKTTCLREACKGIVEAIKDVDRYDLLWEDCEWHNQLSEALSREMLEDCVMIFNDNPKSYSSYSIIELDSK